MALTISTGFVVDDAIVMIENIDRFLEAGESPLDAALKGAGQIGFTIVSLTVSLDRCIDSAIVHGRYRGPPLPRICGHARGHNSGFGFRFLTLTPMMSARLLKSKADHQEGRFYQWSERVYKRVIAVLRADAEMGSAAPNRNPAGYGATLVLTLLLYVIVPKGFFPVQDTGVILGISDAPQSFLRAMSQRQQQLARVILKDPDVAEPFVIHWRGRHQPTPNSGRIQINLKPRNQRSDTASDVIRRLQPELAQQVTGITLYMQPVQDLAVKIVSAARNFSTPWRTWTRRTLDFGRS